MKQKIDKVRKKHEICTHAYEKRAKTDSLRKERTSTYLCIVMSTVPPPQSRTMNLFPADRNEPAFSVLRHAASGSKARARDCEFMSEIKPASKAHVRMKDFAPSCRNKNSQGVFFRRKHQKMQSSNIALASRLTFQMAGMVNTQCTSSVFMLSGTALETSFRASSFT